MKFSTGLSSDNSSKKGIFVYSFISRAAMKLLKSLKKSTFEGQTLIEVLAAISILSIVISGVTVSVITGLSNAQHGKSGNQAKEFGQEGMEVVRQIRDNNIAIFRNYSGLYCLSQGQTSLGAPTANCTSPNVGPYIRTVRIAQNGCAANIASVEVAVLWTDGKCQNGTFCHKDQLNSCLSMLNPYQSSSAGGTSFPTLPIPTGGATAVPPTGAPTSAPCQGLAITTAPYLNKSSYVFGETITGTVAYQNPCSSPYTVLWIGLVGRDANAGNVSLGQNTSITFAPGEIKTITGTYTISGSGPPGQWRYYTAYQDSLGNWHNDTGEILINVGDCPLTVSTPLSLSTTNLIAGSTLTASITYGNNCATAKTVNALQVSVRDSSGATRDFSNKLTNLTIQPGQTSTLTTSGVYSSPLGVWRAYGSYQDIMGWHEDANKVNFNVVAAPTATNTPIPTPLPPTVTPTPRPPSPTPAPTPIPLSGYYKITARNSGKDLVIPGCNNASGTILNQTAPAANNAQEWTIANIGNGYYKLINHCTGTLAGVDGSSLADGANITGGWDDNNYDLQWQLNPISGGYYSLINRNSGKAMSVSGGSTVDGANIVQTAYAGASYQQFTITQAVSGCIAGQVCFVQSSEANDYTTVSTSLNSVKSGNLIVIGVSANGGTVTVTDNAGNNYVQAVSQPSSGTEKVLIFYAQNVTGGNLTITARTTSAGDDITIAAHEYAGAATSNVLDRTMSASASSQSTAVDSGSTSITSQANELVFGAFTITDGQHISTVNAGSGFTLRHNQPDNADFASLATEDKIVTATGAYNATFTISPGYTWRAAVATFRAGAILPTPTPTSVPTLTPTPIAGTLVAFDSKAYASSVNPVATFSVPVTIGNHNNRLLVVYTVYDHPISSMKFNNIPMVLQKSSGYGYYFALDLWTLLDPPIGTYSLQVQSQGTSALAMAATSWYNVNQASPFGTLFSENLLGSAPSATLSNTSNMVIVEAITNEEGNNSMSPTSGQTSLWTQAPPNASFLDFSGAYKTGGASTTLSWSMVDRAAQYGWMALPLKGY